MASHLVQVDLPDVTLSVARYGPVRPASGPPPTVIAAHGFPDDARTFRRLIPALTAAGFEVVVPTLRGYAPSAIPRSGRYDMLALGGDLLALADRYSPDVPVRIIGHDWGGIAGYAAAALAPSRVSHLAALAIPHPGAFLRNLARPAQICRSWYMLFFQVPWLSDWATRVLDMTLVDLLWRAWSPGYRVARDEMAAVKAGLRHRVASTLGYYRALLPTLADSAARRVLLARTAVPTLRLHGTEDGCVGVRVMQDEARWHASRFEQVIVQGAGHFLHLERAGEVASRLLAFFTAAAPGR